MTSDSTNLKRSRNKNTKKAKPKKKRKGLLKKIFLACLFVFLAAFLAACGLFAYYIKDAEPLDEARLSAPSSTRFYDINNVAFLELGTEKREIIQANEIPQQLKDAIVSVEDKRFYSHIGIDPIRIVGSALSNLKNKLTGQAGGLQGGSTLTQQLIKLSYFSTDEKDQTLERKAQEAWLALKLERTKSKDEILTYYINRVYMSNGVYGMETAAKAFYDKSLSELTLPQTALLAGLPQSPTTYDPYIENNELAKERRDIVLSTMLSNDKISQAEYDAAVATPITDGLAPKKSQSETRKVVDNYLKEVIAEVEEKTGKDVYTDGLEVYTNLDLSAQQELYNIVNTENYIAYPDDEFQVATTVMDVNTGEVRAQIGGRKIADDVVFGTNIAVDSQRDVGSTIKPLADYGPAIEYLNYSSAKIIVDQPYTYKGTTKKVNNYDNYYKGALTMRQAIVDSRNTTAAQTFDAVDEKDRSQFLTNLGLSEANGITNIKAISAEIPTLYMAAAYSAFANGGTYYKPFYVKKVIDQNGVETDYSSAGTTAMKASTAYIMTDILKDVIDYGTGTAASIPNLFQAGKTGTSNYEDPSIITNGNTGGAPDISFCGYTRHYAISVWTGYKNYSDAIAYQDQVIAAQVYKNLMTFLAQSQENLDWEKPADVVRYGSEVYVKGHTTNSYYNWSSTSSETPETTTLESSTTSEASVEPAPSEPTENTDPIKTPDEPTTNTTQEQPVE